MTTLDISIKYFIGIAKSSNSREELLSAKAVIRIVESDSYRELADVADQPLNRMTTRTTMKRVIRSVERVSDRIDLAYIRTWRALVRHWMRLVKEV